MPPDPATAATLVLRDGVIMLGAALGFVMLFRRFGLGAVLGYLVAGALIGPEGLRLVNAPEEMLHIADFGIVLLLFLVGLELHPERLWRLERDIFGLGLGQASASLMGAHAIGRSAAELAEARDALAAFLGGRRDDPGDWPGLAVLAAARNFPARHPSILLAFEAAAEAAARVARADAA